jgi:xylulokinase
MTNSRKRELLMGIDVGTSSCKIAVFARNGSVAATAKKDYPIYYPKIGWAEQDVDDWWQAVCEAIKAVWVQGILPEEILGVGVDGQGWSAIAVDKDGQVVARNPIWMDRRAEQLCREVETNLGRERIFSVSGNPFAPNYTLPKVLYWMRHQPEIIRNADKILQTNSFIVLKLTGVMSQDYSSCCWHNFDVANLRYDEALTKELGIPRRLLLEPVNSETIVGRVTKCASTACGLLEGTPVVAGGFDAACAVLGSGVVSNGQTQEHGGQAGGMSICLSTPIPHPQLIFFPHVVPEKWLLTGGTVAGGASLKWFASAIGADPRYMAESCNKGVFELLSEAAERSTVGANGLIFLPYLNGERSPLWDANAQGLFFGLSADKTRDDLTRAVMEGVAFALEHNVEAAAEVGAEVGEMRVTGGSANSRIWTQIKADVTGKRTLVPSSDTTTTLGAAILAGVGIGMFDSYEQAASETVKITRVHEPDASNHVKYARLYKLYKSLYPVLKDSMSELAAIRESVKHAARE